MTKIYRRNIFENGIILLVTLVFLMTTPEGVLNDSLVVKTKFGEVRGLNAQDGDYRMFMGIPYASVNLSNPFGTSIPITNFNGTFNAFDDSLICPQEEEFNKTIVGNLDCLNLNIYAPKNANNLPVLLYIFGGKHKIGFPSRHLYGPKYLVRNNIILVVINFRLGPYGYLCLDTPEVPGNQAFKDQLTAMRWVKDNIDVFGGNPNQVTICGHSSGAQSVELHLMANKEKLFINAIVQSGSALMPPVQFKSDITIPFQLAEYLGLDTEVLSEALKFLAERDPALVIEAAVKLDIKSGLCVEKKFDGVENFMTTNPLYTKLGKADTNVLIGFTDDEMGIAYMNKSDEFYKNLSIIHKMIVKDFDFGNDHNAEDIVKRCYLGDQEYGLESREDFLKFYSDFQFLAPIQRSLNKYFDSGTNSVYIYMFKYDGGRNFVKILSHDTSPNASHGDELGYLFDGNYLKDIPWSGNDQLIIDRITMLWSNFVKYSDPTPSTTDLLPIKWPPATRDKQNYLAIDTVMATGSRPFHDRMAFWDLFYQLYGEYQKGYIYACEDGLIQCTRKNGSTLTTKLPFDVMIVFVLNCFCVQFLVK